MHVMDNLKSHQGHAQILCIIAKVDLSIRGGGPGVGGACGLHHCIKSASLGETSKTYVLSLGTLPFTQKEGLGTRL